MIENFILMQSDIEEPLYYKGMFEDTPDRYDAVVFTFELAGAIVSSCSRQTLFVLYFLYYRKWVMFSW